MSSLKYCFWNWGKKKKVASAQSLNCDFSRSLVKTYLMFSAIFQGRWLGIYSEFMMAPGVSGRWRAVEVKEKKGENRYRNASPTSWMHFLSVPQLMWYSWTIFQDFSIRNQVPWVRDKLYSSARIIFFWAGALLIISPDIKHGICVIEKRDCNKGHRLSQFHWCIFKHH